MSSFFVRGGRELIYTIPLCFISNCVAAFVFHIYLFFFLAMIPGLWGFHTFIGMPTSLRLGVKRYNRYHT